MSCPPTTSSIPTPAPTPTIRVSSTASTTSTNSTAPTILDLVGLDALLANDRTVNALPEAVLQFSGHPTCSLRSTCRGLE